MQKKSGQVALGGIATGMCIALMFATGMIIFLLRTAGAGRTGADCRTGGKRAFHGADRLCGGFAFICFCSAHQGSGAAVYRVFGYYPILQETFAKIAPRR